MELLVRVHRSAMNDAMLERVWLAVRQCPQCFALIAEYQLDLHQAIHRHPSQQDR